jgi:hypothetical protein
LSICETPPGAIPYYDRIPDIARQLTIMRRKDATIAYPADQLKSTAARLQALALSEQWAGRGEAPASYSLPSQLRLRLISLAAEAGEIAQEIESEITSAPRRPRGRPTSTASANSIALYLYQETERLTGHAPSRVVDLNHEEAGEFTALVREVFEILDVKSDPEEAARKAIRGHGDKSGK